MSNNLLLQCIVPFLTQPPKRLPNPQEAQSMPMEQFLQRTSASAALIAQDQNAGNQLSQVFIQNARSLPTNQVIDAIFSAAQGEMTIDKDAHIIAWCKTLVQQVLAIQGTGHGSPQPQKQQHHQQAPPPQQQPYNPPPVSAPTSNVFAHAYFFPSEDSFKQLKSFIDGTKRTLEICVFTITDDHIANAIIAAHQRGVKVRMISDDQQSESRGSDVIRLGQDQGIPYCLDNSPSHMHNKFAIADGQILLNGSYNWTKGARFENRENIVITNSPELIKSFTAEFNKLWKEFQGNTRLQGSPSAYGKSRGMEED